MKTILITGAGTGIGRDSAIALAKRGHKIIATTKTDEQISELRAYILEQQCSGIEIFKLDITDEKYREKIRDLDIDVLINNAGTGETGPLAEIPLDRLRRVFEVNVFGTLALTQIALARMIEKGQGTVIIVSSVAGRIPLPYLEPYGMTKYALSAGAAAMRREVHAVSPNVHISLIEPGAYDTGFNKRMIDKKYEWIGMDSHYYKIIAKLKQSDAQFIFSQKKSIQGIVNKIVTAAESNKPRLRYVAPWYISLGVRLLRALGQ